jgi:hypothetical protein
MAVDAAERRQVEKLLLKELTESHDDNNIRLPRSDLGKSLWGVHVVRRDAVLDSALDCIRAAWTRRKYLAASCRTIGLCDDSDHL